jgi:hypothetical protein
MRKEAIPFMETAEENKKAVSPAVAATQGRVVGGCFRDLCLTILNDRELTQQTDVKEETLSHGPWARADSHANFVWRRETLSWILSGEVCLNLPWIQN